MVEVAVRNDRGLLIRDFLRYSPKAAVREVRNLAKIGQTGEILR